MQLTSAWDNRIANGSAMKSKQMKSTHSSILLRQVSAIEVAQCAGFTSGKAVTLQHKY